MNQMDRIEAKLDQLLAQRGEQPAVTAGTALGPDGRIWADGTGWITPRDHQVPEPTPRPEGAGAQAAAEARAALANARKDLT